MPESHSTTPGSSPPIASVVIPAHNEASVIGRCVETLLRDAAPGEFEVVVVSNGSTDATAEVARHAGHGVQVVETDVASKAVALNLGDAATTVFPRAYLDADVEMDAASLRGVVATLRGGALCSAPQMHLEFGAATWPVRAFYRAFSRLPYLADDPIGGVYVLSEHGRSLFGSFPDLTADDLFVRNLFAPGERVTATGGTYTVHTPRDVRSLLAIRERAYRGAAEYSDAGHRSAAGSTLSPSRLLRGMLADPVGMSVFLAVNVTAKVRVRRRASTPAWERDSSSR